MTQAAVLTGIGAALLSRVVSQVCVYSTQSYKETSNNYHSVINRQQELIKLTPRAELFGRDPSPAKTEFQANMTQVVHLKKEVFKVSVVMTSVLSLILLWKTILLPRILDTLRNFGETQRVKLTFRQSLDLPAPVIEALETGYT